MKSTGFEQTFTNEQFWFALICYVLTDNNNMLMTVFKSSLIT